MRRILPFLSLLTLLPSLASAKDVTVTPSTFESSLTQTVDGVKFTFDQGTNNQNKPKYSSDTEFRFYGGNTLAVEGNRIQKIVFTVAASNPGNCSASGVTFTTSSDKTVVTGTVSPALDNIVISNGKNNNQAQMKFSKIVVTVADAGEPTQLGNPVISIGESSFTISSVENGEVYYCVNNSETAVAEDCTIPYTGEVALETTPGTYYIHTYAKATDTSAYTDSNVVSSTYVVRDPNAKEFTATVKFIDGEQSWKDYNSVPHENTWVSTDKLFSFKTVASLEPGHSGNNYPIVSTSSPKGLRIYNTSSNLITVYAPDGYKFKSVSYTSSDDKNHVSFDNTEQNNNDPYEFPSAASDFGLRSVKSNKNNNTAVQTITVVLEKDEIVEPEKKVYAHPFGESIDPVMEGDTYQFELGAEHPSITYTWEGDAHCSIDDNGLLRGESVGTDRITASWGDDVWEEGSARFSVTIFEKPIEKQPLASPTFSLDEAEKTVTISKEGEGTIYFAVNNNETATAEECVKMYDAPIPFETEPGTYYVHAYVRADETSQYYSDSSVTEISYEVAAIQKIYIENIDEALEYGRIDDVVEEGDLEVSVCNFVIKSGLHVYAVDGTSVYVTDNVNGGKGTRIDDVPADMATDKVLVNVTVRYVHNKVTGVESFRHVSHEAGLNSASPEATELELSDFYGRQADYLHHYIKLKNVYYDGEAGTISQPAAAQEMMSRAPAGHTNVIDVDKTVLGSAYGYADVWGYVKHDGTQPVFTALRLGEIQTGIDGVEADGGVAVVNGEIVAPEGSELFTVNGMRVAASGCQAPGLYVVRLCGGQAVKVVVK